MTAIDRTAYPRLGERLTHEELQARYRLSETERIFIRAVARGDAGRLTLAALLKTRQNSGRFPSPQEIPGTVLSYLAAQLGMTVQPPPVEEDKGKQTLHRYRTAIRVHLGLSAFSKAGEGVVTRVVLDAAETMSDPADLINRAIEALRDAWIDLPAFSTLDRMANHVRAQVHERIHARIAARLSAENAGVLDALLTVPSDAPTTAFSRLKQTPGPARPATIRLWTERLAWLTGLIDPDPPLEGVSHTKIRQFAAEAAVLEVSELLDMEKSKRHTLLLALVRQARTRSRDELVEMFLFRIRRTQAAAKEKLAALRDQHRAMEESLISIFGEVLVTARGEAADDLFGHQIRSLLSRQGGVEELAQQCETVSAWHGNNELPLLWPIHAKTRTLLFGLLDQMTIRTATQDRSLLDALGLVVKHRHARRDEVSGEIDLGFASQRWRSFVRKPHKDGRAVNRRALEVCVFIHLANALQTGDLYIIGSEAFADYRDQLLPWPDCQPRMADYCAGLGMPETGDDFVALIKAQLTKAANTVDEGFPGNAELTLDADGVPHLKRQPATDPPDGLAAFEQEIRNRMPERHLLDILKSTEHWSRYTRHFGPPSGSDPKLPHAVRRYLLTVFGYGCNLGPTQTARHAPDIATSQTLRRINAQHINAGKLEAAMADLIGEYSRFSLPRHWGKGQAAIADGTHVPLRENNLLGSRHIRYGGYGGIAYHHIADSYIALFTTFIACGVWEAVHILDGLLKNRSQIQPDTLHADTHGQSETVFGLSRLLGITLMPRMRTWSDVIFYRPTKQTKYAHIDKLFTDTIDWDLIATHWQDMMQVVLSIQAGRVLPSMLLRKLGTHNRKSRLYRAFRELGRVERTLFLLRYVSSPEVRRGIRAETTKVEAFNDFLDWVSFGGPLIRSGDPVEQEKQLKYASLVANAIMLNNVADLNDVLSSMARDGHPVTPELVARVSPYTREHIRRFGQYVLDMANLPNPLDPAPLPFELAL
jgi:TnpA family transposase